MQLYLLQMIQYVSQMLNLELFTEQFRDLFTKHHPMYYLETCTERDKFCRALYMVPAYLFVGPTLLGTIF